MRVIFSRTNEAASPRRPTDRIGRSSGERLRAHPFGRAVPLQSADGNQQSDSVVPIVGMETVCCKTLGASEHPPS